MSQNLLICYAEGCDHMRTFKGLIIFIVIAVIILVVVMFSPRADGSYIWNPFHYARIVEVDYRAVVVDEPGSYGKIIVTERLTFDIRAFSQNNLFWELWRALPEQYIDGVRVEYRVNSVQQVFDDGREPITFRESPILYWNPSDFVNTADGLGPQQWYHSEGPYNPHRRQFECVLFYVDGLFRETVIFEIEYVMYNAAMRWADSSELHLSFFSGSDVNHLRSFSGQILFPEDIMPRAENHDVFTFGTNANGFHFSESTAINSGYHTFYFNLDRSQLRFRPYNQYLEFILISHGDDRHIFTQYASINDYFYYDALDEIMMEIAKYEALHENARSNKIATLVAFIIITLLALGIVFLANYVTNKKYNFYKSTIDIDFFKDIPSQLDPSFASTLTFCKRKTKLDIQNGYSAAILSLTRKGYIELEKFYKSGDWAFENVKVIVKHKPAQSQSESNATAGTAQTMPPHESATSHEEQPTISLEPLTPTEDLYFNLILRHSRGFEMRLSQFQRKISEDFQHTNSFISNVKNAVTQIGVSQGYFQKANFKQPKELVREWVWLLGIIGTILLVPVNLISLQTRIGFAFGAFFIGGFGFIACAVILNKLYRNHVLLTQFGEDEYAKWRGLYNFLNSETLMKERTIVELPLWENYLIYATAFGISGKVIKALEVRCQNADASPILSSNSYYRANGFRIRGGHRSFSSATRTASYTARYGGHGGYSGSYGGRGGGGGGGG